MSNDEFISDFFLLGEPPEFLLTASIIIPLALLMFTLGYFLKPPKSNVSYLLLLNRDNWNTSRLFFVVIIFITVAVIAIILFFRQTGAEFVSLSDLSAKRTFVVEGADYRFASLGYHRWAASLITPAFYLLVMWLAASGRTWFSVPGLFVALVGGLATVFPFLTSDRGEFALVPIVALLIWHYARSKINLKTLILIGTFAMFSITILTGFRAGFSDINELRPYLTGQKVFETIVGNRNFFGVAKTAHIIEAVPKQLEYQYGKTFVLWLAAPIPRTLWPEKPIINTGQMLGEVIFRSGIGMSGGGVPPGFVAELYWNFNLFGVLIGMFLLGCWLRFIYQNALPYLSTHKNALLIYMLPFSFSLLGDSVSQVMLSTITDFVPLFLTLLFIGQCSRNHVNAKGVK
jgi:oligosaccharide repeat unit polymerase